ncbi:L-lysine permease [Methanocella sp. CWC-04]|uniref:L-lysine permease n=1 Tax=Methanooceanicella nereidis TaxID=2052831 RepID=A0AAP2RG26_9EURY|nr:LysE family transporter [Methanocella sp. CWC-04]MCD1295577.1 L-lysine permease [Methanocella sp. CWC-04]
MIEYILQGFILGIAYVAPIGMQNLYIINSAIKMDRIGAYKVALITVLFDISLAIACFFGIGVLLEAFPALKGAILVIGCIAVIYFGIKLIMAKPSLKSDVNVEASTLKVIAICFAVTWLNPQAIIDGSILLGGFRASLPAVASDFFILGVVLSSFTWFMGLTTVTSQFKKVLDEKTLHYVNLICGVIIVFYGLLLGYSFLVML